MSKIPGAPFVGMIIAILAAFFTVEADAQFITTIAGNGFHGTMGDNGPALCAGIPYPQGVCVDPAGNVYVTSSNTVRRVEAATGIITRIAGSDSYGSSGDGGPAADALMQFPYDMCLDKNGNLYVSEVGGSRIRKITPSGIISTYAGTGSVGYSGDGGLATAATFNHPEGIAMDKNGNMYIADQYNMAIRKINGATGMMSTIAGNGTSNYSGDGGLAVNAGVPYPISVCTDEAGNVYFAEVFNGNTSRIRKVDVSTGIITTVAGTNTSGYSGDGGLAINAELFDPVSVRIDNDGNIYLTDYDAPRIRKIDAATGIIHTIAGNGNNDFTGDGGPAESGSMHYPLGIALGTDGSIYVADCFNQRIRKITAEYESPVKSHSQVTISQSPATPCSGAELVYTASVTNRGAQEQFRWYVNGIAVGTGGSQFSSNTLKEKDTVVCRYATTDCAGEATASSNALVVTYTNALFPDVRISASAASICPGGMVTVNAVAENAGTDPVFRWFRNGTPEGGNTDTYRFAASLTSDRIYCLVTPSGGCTSNDISSDTMVITAYPLPSVTLDPSDTIVSAGGSARLTARVAGDYSSVSWSPSSSVQDPAGLVTQTTPVERNEAIAFTVNTPEGCMVSDTVQLHVFLQLVMPNAFTPNGDGVNDQFRIPPNVSIDLKEFSIFNRWGNKIFTTNDLARGWTGAGADNGVYAWVIRGNVKGQMLIFKGTLVLAR